MPTALPTFMGTSIQARSEMSAHTLSDRTLYSAPYSFRHPQSDWSCRRSFPNWVNSSLIAESSSRWQWTHKQQSVLAPILYRLWRNSDWRIALTSHTTKLTNSSSRQQKKQQIFSDLLLFVSLSNHRIFHFSKGSII